MSITELLIAIPTTAVLVGSGINFTSRQTQSVAHSVLKGARADLVTRQLELIAEDIRTSGSNPMISGAQAKSTDPTFVDVDNKSYPYGLNPYPNGTYTALSIFRISGADPHRTEPWGAGPSEDEVYELKDFDKGGVANDLVRTDYWQVGSQLKEQTTLILKNIQSFELHYFYSTSLLNPNSVVHVSSEGKKLLPPEKNKAATAPIADEIKAVRVVITYFDSTAQKNRSQEITVRKMIRAS